jgi:hypothetical protein
MNRNAATNASLPEQEQGADMRRNLTILILASVVLLSTGVAMAETAISYQGRLDAGGQAFNGSVDLDFELYDAASGGSAMGAPVTINGVAVQQGLFQVELDFGAQAWELGRWLQITVDGQLLSPRQKVTAAPLAARAESVIEEAIGSQELEDGGVQAQDIANDSIHSNHIVDGTITSADIASGGVEPENVAGGIMNSLTRSNIYVRSKAESVALINAVVSASARCDAAEDFPVSGECYVPSVAEVTLREFAPSDWADPTLPAGYTCTYKTHTSSTVTFEARIHCLNVTP